MKARFGASSPAQNYAIKVRWLVGFLVSVIVLLGAAFIIVAQNATPSPSNLAAASEALGGKDLLTGKTEVLVALQRIEQGAKLQESQFTSVSMDQTQVPMGALRKWDAPKILNKYSSRLINPQTPLLLDDVADRPSQAALDIPPGYRGVSIVVDRRSGIDGFVRPDSRVDVLLAFQKDGKTQVATVVRSVKVLSVGGVTIRAEENGQVANNDMQGPTTITLLATERDSKKIELARTIGSLSLSLLGEGESITGNEDPDTIDWNVLVGIKEAKQEIAPAEPANSGVLYVTDPKTGKQVRYVLPEMGRNWRRDSNF